MVFPVTSITKNMKLVKEIYALVIEVGSKLLLAAIKILRIIKIIYFYKFSRKLNKFINNGKDKFATFTGITWMYFQDSLFVGTIILLVIKTIYRILFQENPIWYINILIYVFGTLMAIKFDLLPPIRELIVEIIKRNIGKTFWYDREIMSNDERVPENDIRLRSNYEFAFEYLLTCLVWVRLICFQEPILFTLFKSIFIFFLIFNKFLILASIVSFISISGRLIIYLSDFSHAELFHKLKMFEKLSNDETYKPTWRNANIILIWVTRTFTYRNSFLENRALFETINFDIYLAAFMHKFTQKYYELLPPIFSIIKDKNTNLHYLLKDNSYSAKENFKPFFQYESRLLYVKKYISVDSLQPILKKTKKNNLLFGVLVTSAIILVAYFLRIPVNAEMLELSGKVIVGSKITLRLKSEQKNNTVDKFVNKELKETLESLVTPYERIPHMSLYELIIKPSLTILNRFNYMTKRKTPTIELSPITHWEGHAYCSTQIGYGNILNQEQTKLILENIKNGVFTTCIPGIDYAKDRISYPQIIPRRNELFELDSFFILFFKKQYEKSQVSHVSFIYIKYEIPTSPYATFNQIIDTLDAAITYHRLMSNLPPINNEGADSTEIFKNNMEHASLCNLAKIILQKKQSRMQFADTPDDELQKKINILKTFNETIAISPKTTPAVVSTVEHMQQALNIAKTRSKDHFSHLNEPKPQITNKNKHVNINQSTFSDID